MLEVVSKEIIRTSSRGTTSQLANDVARGAFVLIRFSDTFLFEIFDRPKEPKTRKAGSSRLADFEEQQAL